MKLIQIKYKKSAENNKNDLLTQTSLGIATTFGTIFLKKGTRIPQQGFSRHPFNEISIIIEGVIEMLNENENVIGYLKPGMAIYINALEPQAGNVIKDTKIIYVLNQKIKKNEE